MAVFGDLNEAQIIGNITQDLEVRYTTGGSAVTNFSVATNRSYRKQGSEEWQEEVSFHNVVVWGNDAEFLSQRAGKGTRVFVKGRLQTRSWEDQDGKKNYRTEIISERIILLDRYERGAEKQSGGDDSGSHNAGGFGGGSDSGAGKAKSDSKTAKGEKKGKSADVEEIDPDDLPF